MAQQIDAFKAKLDKALHEKNAFTDILEKIETKTNVRRLYLVMGVGGALSLFLLIGFFSEAICMLIGFLYPAYMSVKAIESKGKDDDTKWLTYWVVYSAFSLVEFFTDIFLFWIPFYWLLKCIFLLYCMVPTSWNGSIMIYNKVIRPFILKHQAKVDEALDKAAGVAQEVLDEVTRQRLLSQQEENEEEIVEEEDEVDEYEAEESAKDAAASAMRNKMD